MIKTKMYGQTDYESQDMNNSLIIDVIKFWHKVEFFVPFDLEDACSQLKTQYVLSDAQLEHQGDDILPWLSPQGLSKAGGLPQYKYQHYLYLLPFNKNELTRISEKIFSRDTKIHNDPDDIQQIEFEERFDDEGETCFARLLLDADGQFDASHLSLSTLPWALGRLAANELSALNSQQYETEQIKLKTELRLLSDHLHNPDSVLNTETAAKKPGVMNAKGLIALIHILKCWAGFAPRHPVSLVMQLRQLPAEKKEQALVVIQEAAKKNDADEDDALDILNSFYLDDLEKICNDHHIEKNLLAAYIQGNNNTARKNIYEKSQTDFIAAKLSPKHTGEGRWLHESHHLMSLMQQFAINESFHPDENQGAIFSVNGPPGTGKTTLLQDIIATNIVRRAGNLAEFEKTQDTFRADKLLVTFDDNSRRDIRLLDDRLTGFEMIVVSSNNAAIENISKELPLKAKIGENWQTETCQYLAPVVSKLFAEHASGRVQALANAQKPWGLVSVSLGNSVNRNRFCDRVFYAPEGKEEAKARIDAGECLTLWEWKKQYRGCSFRQARQDFLKAQEAFRDYQQKIIALSELHVKMAGKNLQAYLEEHCAKELQAICEFEKKNAALQQKEKSLMLALEKKRQQQENFHQQLLKHKQFKPGILEFLLFGANAKNYKIHMRVHRRCLDPMFKIANEIAYNNKMLNARKLAGSIHDFPQSAWHHVAGQATDKQYVEEQGEYLAKLFADLYMAQRKLPALYVITPFKRVKMRLQKLLQDTGSWQRYLPAGVFLPDREVLKKWCLTHIGTVHTFQGKEAPLVIFVLGADKNQAGAAKWASSKPNLLNVALTRAKNAIYLIGDYELWSGKKYFSSLAESLIIKNHLRQNQENPV